LAGYAIATLGADRGGVHLFGDGLERGLRLSDAEGRAAQRDH
jgi:hypothetical protein